MMEKQPEPAWQTALFISISIAAVSFALPAAMDGEWLRAAAIVGGLIVAEIAILLSVRAVRRRRGGPPTSD